ncbi:POL4 protein, partial [Nyctibius bracteatus]|nr:POL4 protein [Nyctibius bracteatus]
LRYHTHWGTQALCDQFLRDYGYIGIFEIAKQVTNRCLTCQKVNKKVMRRTPPGGRSIASRPFENIQIDFTELPKVNRWKYLLVIVDQLTHWVEATPVARAAANVVAKVLLEEIIPRYGLVNSINSDRGTHFSSRVIQTVTANLGIKWELHTPWHPQSSGRVERMNQTIKQTLTKLMLETQLSWVKCLPLALLRIRTKPRTDTGLSPYEMLFGMPYLATNRGQDTYGIDKNIRTYVQTMAKRLQYMREQGMIAQSTSLNFKIHQLNPGDWVLIKTW